MQFFPKNEKYFPLFTGGDTPDVVQKRNEWRKQIKENLMAAAANGKDLEGACLHFYIMFESSMHFSSISKLFYLVGFTYTL